MVDKRDNSVRNKYGRKIGLLVLFMMSLGLVGCSALGDERLSVQQMSTTEEMQDTQRGTDSIETKGKEMHTNKALSQNEISDKDANKAFKEKTSKTDKKEAKKEAKNTKTKNKKQSDRVAFLGDSRTEGLAISGLYKDADFYAKCGICLNQILSNHSFQLKNGKKGNMLDALFQKDYDKIYLMFGLNELGWPYEKEFEKYYKEIVEKIKQKYPEATIYIQSILPIVESKGDEIYNNQNINKFNGYIQNVAKDTGCQYVDVAQVMKKKGSLPEEASEDGIHLNRKYLEKWYEYLKENT